MGEEGLGREAARCARTMVKETAASTALSVGRLDMYLMGAGPLISLREIGEGCCQGTHSNPANTIRVPIFLKLPARGGQVQKTTKSSVALDPCANLGHIEMVKAVYLVAVQPITEGHAAQTALPATGKTTLEDNGRVNTVTPCPTPSDSKTWDPPIALDHLNSEQQHILRKNAKG